MLWTPDTETQFPADPAKHGGGRRPRHRVVFPRSVILWYHPPRNMSSSPSEKKSTSPVVKRSRGRLRLKLRRRTWLTIAGGVIAIAAVGGVFAFTEFNLTTLRETLERSIGGLNPILLIALMATLPVAGFSVGILYLVVGAKVGPVVGGAIVAATTAIHLLATHWISRSFLREPLVRLLSRRKHRLPEIPPGENAAISVMAALVPGVPYFARNYLLALSGVPLRIYFWICLPIYVARSYITIFLGDLTGDPSRRTLLVLAIVYAVKLAVCGYLISRLRRRYKERQSTSKKPTAHANTPSRESRPKRPDLIESR